VNSYRNFVDLSTRKFVISLSFLSEIVLRTLYLAIASGLLWHSQYGTAWSPKEPMCGTWGSEGDIAENPLFHKLEFCNCSMG